MAKVNILPYGKIKCAEDIGKIIREHRKQQKITQTELAGLSNVGVRFISDLENGKPSIELGKTLRVANILSLELMLIPREKLPW